MTELSSQSHSGGITPATMMLDRGYGRPTKTASPEVSTPFVPKEILLAAYTGSVKS